MRFATVICLLALLASMPAAVGAYNCAVSPNVVDATTSEGERVVLRTRGAGANSTVIVFDDGWSDDRSVRLRPRRTEWSANGTSPQRWTEVVPAGSNGWWIVTEEGTLYRYDSEWEYTGARRTLGTTGVRGAARLDGALYVLTAERLTRYDSDWQPQERYEHPVSGAGGLSAARGALWVTSARAGSGGRVYRFDPTADGLSVRRGGDFDWAVRQPVAVVPDGDSGWAVLETDGRLTRHTGYWQFTGTLATVAEGVRRGCPTGWFLWAVGVPAFGLASLLALWDGISRHRDRGRRFWTVLFGTVAAWCVAGGIRLGLLPWPLSLVYRVPDGILAAALVGLPVTATLLLVGWQEEPTASAVDALQHAVGARWRLVAREAVTAVVSQAPAVVVALSLL